MGISKIARLAVSWTLFPFICPGTQAARKIAPPQASNCTSAESSAKSMERFQEIFPNAVPIREALSKSSRLPSAFPAFETISISLDSALIFCKYSAFGS
ncbi:Uncharacterised protein [Candidatus Gugararchaeum adminiculabundum]|nr:Uncharacterised protein [Candidatus Gugararchaeum adminiculabundum]